MDYEFRPGDRVECILGESPVRVGDVGEVLDTRPGLGVAVRWDRYDRRFHSCGDRCADCHGWWISRLSLSLIDSANCSLPDMDVAPLL